MLKWKAPDTVPARKDTFLADFQKKAKRAANKMKGVVHAQQILNQAAADIKKVGCAQPSQPILTKLIMMEYSPRLIFRKHMGWLKEQKMT